MDKNSPVTENFLKDYKERGYTILDLITKYV